MIYSQRATTEKGRKDLWQAQEMKFKASSSSFGSQKYKKKMKEKI